MPYSAAFISFINSVTQIYSSSKRHSTVSGTDTEVQTISKNAPLHPNPPRYPHHCPQPDCHSYKRSFPRGFLLADIKQDWRGVVFLFPSARGCWHKIVQRECCAATAATGAQ